MPASFRSLIIQGLLAWFFMVTGAVTLWLAAPMEALTLNHLIGLVAGWTLSWGAALYILHRYRPEAELAFLPLIALLTGWGLLLLARTAPNFLFRQIGWLFLSVVALCVVSLIPLLPRWMRRYRYLLLLSGLSLLLITLFFGANPSGYGAELWLNFLGFYFQPSELLKLILVIYLAAYLSDRQGLLSSPQPRQRLWLAVLGPMLAMVGLAILLLAWQNDLGAAMLFYLTALTMLYLAWGRTSYIVLGLLIFAPILYLGAQLSSRVALRVSIWLDPWAPEQADRAFQILQSLFAMGAGGIVGEGLGLGRPDMIPAVHTDFVYAALVEEFGAVGSIALLALMALFVQRCMRLAQRAAAPFETLLAGGIGALFGIQTLVIVAGNAKLIPITGVTLPFLSYGGSSLFISLIAVGLLINLSAPHPPPLDLTLASSTIPPLPRTAARLGTALLILLGLTALGTGYWTVIQADTLRNWLTNPRRILAEARIQRGNILDRRGEILAGIAVDEEGFVDRTYPVPESAPVVGYTTLDYGDAGIEARCAPLLRGEINRSPETALWDGLLHRAPAGRSVQLTLDARLQRLAQQQLQGHRGAVILADAHTGEILALASAPIFTPTSVAADWEQLRTDPDAPLLNRATQGLVQPGSALETILLAEALHSHSLPTLTASITGPIILTDLTVTCRMQPTDISWKSTLAAACPAPFADLGEQLGTGGLAAAFSRWGLNSPPALELPTVAAPWNSAAVDPRREALGQGTLLVTPLQMLEIVVTLGNQGTHIPLHLLTTSQPGCNPSPEVLPTQVISPEEAAQIRELWPDWNFGIGHFGQAQAGPQRTLTWFLALNSKEAPRYAVVILLENAAPPSTAIEIGRQLLQGAVEP